MSSSDKRSPSAPVAPPGLEIIPPELLGLANDADTGVYDTVEIEDMEFDEDAEAYYYPCPCGDKFYISLRDLRSGEDVATCPSCSLRVKVIYDPEDFVEYEDE